MVAHLTLLHGRMVLAMVACQAALLSANLATAHANDSAPTSTLAVHSALFSGDTLSVAGRDSQVQLVVMSTRAGGAQSDVSRDVQYEIEPATLAAVTSDGLLTPLGDGKGRLTVIASDGAGRTDVALQVSHVTDDLPVNFGNEIVPIFTRFGCNGGGCHGKSGGQNGFRLSLLGFEPKEDYEYLLQETRSRRIFPAAPDHSLLLIKAIGSLPHGGGARFTKDDPAYRTLRRWIGQGMPYGSDDDPVVTQIEVLPRERTLRAGEQQQLAVIAHYSDGGRADVTRMCHFESNAADLAEVSPTGLITAGTRAGRAAVMIRFQTHVDVFRAAVPLGQHEFVVPKSDNVVDRYVFANLQELGLPPSSIADDSTYLRRVTLAIAGRLPTLAETRHFLDDQQPTKREQLVQRLLDSNDYADFFAKKWADILRNRRSSDDRKPLTFAFHNWLRQQLQQNTPYNDIVRQVIAATGPIETTPPVAWYHEVREVEQQVEDMAQLFLGMRLQCARCHHHPQEKWSQADYYGLAAFFAQVGRKTSPTDRRHFGIYHREGNASSRHPKSGVSIPPTPLGAPPLQLAPDQDPRQRLADWFSQPDNPFFARALVNRYWKHFFSRGLVEPEDDMRVTNPPSNPELLDGLANDFISSDFNLKKLVYTICTSVTFQLSAFPNEFNQQDEQSFSRFLPRRLPAEVLADAIDALTDQHTQYAGMPANVRAVELPDSNFDSFMLTIFGRPVGESACECERTSDVSLAQTLHLINSQDIQKKLQDGRCKSIQDDADDETVNAWIDDLYLIAFSRHAAPDEVATATEYLKQKKEQPAAAREDILWAVINTKEFLFNH
ncbi:MAG: DUF1549 domain-containing protein [Pirellulaceae bacterium]|nr:DUF1549 domain-containing protein [Planctomycetales bacterium]